MARTGWILMGAESQIRPVEVKLNKDDEKQSYTEARALALTQLRDHVAPYLDQISRLESDEFSLTRRLPQFKAWRYARRNAVVVAKTKKRACEIVRESRYGFDQYWRECDDDWWYDLASHEGLWIEEIDDRKAGTGVFYHPISREEKRQIAEGYVAQFRSMDIFDLLTRVGQRITETGEHETGTPYRVDVRFEVRSFDPDKVAVEITVDDHPGWYCSEYQTVYRDIPREPMVNWGDEGF